MKTYTEITKGMKLRVRLSKLGYIVLKSILIGMMQNATFSDNYIYIKL